MPEPTGLAAPAGEIILGLFRFTIHDNRIDYQSDSYVLVQQGRVVLIDPLPMAEQELARFGPVEAICLTASCHERSAWRYRRALKVPVYAPEGGVDFEEPPDRWYRDGDKLPGGLVAVHAPGPTEAYHAFFLPREGGVLFFGDLLTNAGGAGLAFVPDEYQDEPARTRETVRRLLGMNFTIFCSHHGDPILTGAKDTITRLLSQEAKG
jgi:glyoxylase-like metal-dependent hydrolase (beta-lactamase superfamily II)